MDFSIIDKMFNVYKNENIDYAEEFFINCYKKYDENSKDSLITLLKEYIKQQTNLVGNYFVSNKDTLRDEYNLVNDIVTAFQNLVMSVDFFMVDLTNQAHDKSSFEWEQPRFIKPHDLFNMNINVLEEAVKENGECFLEDFNKIKNLISYVKKNNVLKKLYKDGSWYEVDFEELIYNIYDFIEDKSVFSSEYGASYQLSLFLFEKIKSNCAEMLDSSFDKFRPNLNSTKQIRADFGKLIFSRNLLMFFKTGIMPNYDGLTDFSVDFSEKIKLFDDFKKLYNKNFDEILFREKQGNFICNPEVYNNNYELEAGRCVKQGNKRIFGYIVSCADTYKSITNYYLIHIEINDVTNMFSNYEMQINIIPHGNIDYRLQLMRLDNWENEQPHRNIARKLSTKTHVHIYNEFDLLRGKTNGAYDIAYNINGEGISFDSSLKTFLDVLDLGSDISTKIYDSTIKKLYEIKKASDVKEV